MWGQATALKLVLPEPTTGPLEEKSSRNQNGLRYYQQLSPVKSSSIVVVKRVATEYAKCKSRSFMYPRLSICDGQCIRD